MNKKPTYLLVVFLFIFFSCNKDRNQDNGNSKIGFNKISLVSEDIAKNVAIAFNPEIIFNSNQAPIGTLQQNNSNKNNLKGINKIKSSLTITDHSGKPALYIFNFENDGGFLVVSADYGIQPILAYVEHGEFKKEEVPPTYVEWLNRTIENTEIVRKGIYDNTKLAKLAWKAYKNNSQNPSSNLKLDYVQPDPCVEYNIYNTIGPLVPVTWGQGCSYNDLCPSLSCSICYGNDHAYTGCVATSTAQIIKFWEPVNFFNYSYSSMPTTFGNNEVQKLMRDVGYYVNMTYGCSSSGAYDNDIPNALKSVFGFSSANYINYSFSDDYQRVKDNLNNGWPILLSGYQTKNEFLGFPTSYTDGHTWVCDGYSEQTYYTCDANGNQSGMSYLLFHMNWGWHETTGSNDYNGWFAFNNWNIPNINYNYQYAKSAVMEIHL